MNGAAPRDGRGLIVAVTLGSMLVPLNSTMIAVALPDVIDDLDTGLGSATWLVTSYLIAMVVLQPVAGRMGDRFGRRPLVLGGLAGFLVASIGAALAPTLALLITFRLLQAATGALVIPNGLALVREHTGSQRLGARLGLIGAALTLAAAAGPPLGGVLIAAFGWRAIFFVNVPAAAAALALSVRAIPRLRRARGESRHAHRLGRLPAGLVVACSGIALTNLAMYVTLLSIPLLLARRPGVDIMQVGLVLGCLSITTAVLSPVGGRLSDRVGRRIPAFAGAALLTVSLTSLSLDPDAGSGVLAVHLLAIGAGVGIAAPALQTAAIESVAVAHSGTAAGLSSTSRYVGSIIGTLLLAGPLAPEATGSGGFGLLYAALAGCAAAALLAALFMPGRGSRGAEEGLPAPVARETL